MRVLDLMTDQRQELGRSRWHLVSQSQIDQFASATGDDQWIHVDPDRAADGPFGSTIAHGYLLLSMVPVFLREIMSIEDRTMGVNYGVNRVRFTSPVPSGSRVRASLALVRGESRSDGGITTTLELTLELEKQHRPALVAELIIINYGPPTPSE